MLLLKPVSVLSLAMFFSDMIISLIQFILLFISVLPNTTFLITLWTYESTAIVDSSVCNLS